MVAEKKARFARANFFIAHARGKEETKKRKMIPHLLSNPRCATPDPIYFVLSVLMTSCVTVVAYSAFLVSCMWLAGFDVAARIRVAHTPSLRWRPVFSAFPTSRPTIRRA